MRAIHWVRSRQEERELAWWLSLAAYDMRDRSLNNRIYLLYLILFFTVWTFITLTLFASGGAIVLHLINPTDPVRAAAFLEVLLMGVWSVYSFWQSFKRSPIVFSEQDGFLIGQTPVSRRHVAIRWFLMPWLKSAVPFWLAAITLGFSVAETNMAGAINESRILEYAVYGLRAWLAILPVHLALYSLHWSVGISRLQKDFERRWLAWLVIPASVLFFSFLLIFTFDIAGSSLVPWINIAEAVVYPLRAGFAHSQISDWLFPGGIFALFALGLMVWRSSTFSLSRAAEETRETELVQSAIQYGFSSYAEQLQTQQRLGVKRAPSKLPSAAGAGILIWKDILQSQRSFRLSAIFVWLGMLMVTVFFSFLPDIGSRALAVAFLIIQIEQVSVIRLRDDLSRWSLVRQLPISPKKFLKFELSSAYLLSVLICVIGLVIGSIIFRTSIDGLAVLIPGIAAGAAGMAAFDVLRRSRSDLLNDGTAPALSAGGIILGLIIAAVPLLIDALIPGGVGLGMAALLSLGLGFMAFNLAARSFRNLGGS